MAEVQLYKRGTGNNVIEGVDGTVDSARLLSLGLGAAPAAQEGSLLLADAATTSAYIQATDGASAGLSPSDEGRLRYNATTQKWEASENGDVYQPIVRPPLICLFADQLDSPVNADWAVNALAPASADSNNAGLTVRMFDDTTEEGVGFILTVPSDATNITFFLKGRAETAPGAAVAVVPTIYNRNIPDDAAIGSWTAGTDLTALSIPANENFQYDSQVFTLAALSITAGNVTQFELTRNTGAGGDTLVGDWAMLEVQVEFS